MVEFDKEEYKKHPRILEIRFVLLFETFVTEYGYNGSISYMESLCSSFNCNITLIQGLINRRNEIKKLSKTNRVLWRQQVLFCAYCYDETTYKVANDFLGIKPHTIYQQKELYCLDNFLTKEWLTDLDNSVTICGLYPYKVEITRFLQIINNLTNVLCKWRGGR